MRKVEYSQIVRRKLKALRVRLTREFGSEVSGKSLKQITDAARSLENFTQKGVSVSAMYEIDCDYRYLYVGHNYYKISSIENNIRLAGSGVFLCLKGMCTIPFGE